MRVTLRLALAVFALAQAAPALAAKPARKADAPLPAAKAQVTDTEVGLDAKDEARTAAEEYLQAISHQGNDGAIETLLGGATLTARIFAIENWKVVGREKHRHEEGQLADLHAYVAAIDKAGRDALSGMLGGGPAAGADDPDGLGVQEISADDAKRMLEPTRKKAASFAKSHPVFAYLARVDRQVYWHPKNPFRKLLADAGAKGKYTVDFDLFWIETVEGAHEDKNVRKWPLRIVRFRSGGVDTGLKVLPASDWNAE